MKLSATHAFNCIVLVKFACTSCEDIPLALTHYPLAAHDHWLPEFLMCAYCTHMKYSCTINREIFVYENIHVLNICVKFSRVPHENILTQKFCEVEITVHVSQIKQLLAMYTSLFCYRNS